MEKEFLKQIEKNQGIIHKVCNLYSNTESDKEDLFQEIVLQLWKSYSSFKGDSKFSTWMYRVALNTALYPFRKKNSNMRFNQLSHTEYEIPTDERETELKDEIQILYKAINQLNEIERAVILLYLEDQSYQEIAEITGLTETNVGVRINRIKKKLSNILNRKEYGFR